MPVGGPRARCPGFRRRERPPGAASARHYRGVLLGIDSKALVDIASRHGCVLSLTRRIGEYVPRGAPLIEVQGDEAPRGPRCVQVDLGRADALPGSALRHPTARRHRDAGALPAINAPTSAVQVLDRLSDLLPQIAERPDPTGLFADETGNVRLIVPRHRLVTHRRARLHRDPHLRSRLAAGDAKAPSPASTGSSPTSRASVIHRSSGSAPSSWLPIEARPRRRRTR